ncbi:hypothetical protein [Erythrobacter rubeus]|uniref:Uncharacterized protein n=1 Tax=Erythrobacter rubeus TaxID=2760803 RepID=A0ABR8KUK1_9SPHN|nr:hypothetical protein [Erythrobacter rubeus]MBD2843035.1 hypothetical protein [Erythrobacter rubeus]
MGIFQRVSAGRAGSDGAWQRREKQTVASHAAFVPMLAVWGALVSALSVLVVPSGLLMQSVADIGLGALQSLPPLAIAALAACVGAILAAGFAAAVKRQIAQQPNPASVQPFNAQVEPIDPMSELGSAALDEPLALEDHMAIEPEGSGFELDEPAVLEPAELLANAPEPAGEHFEDTENTVDHLEAREAPREMSLAEFAELPGRNAVWVQEEAEEEPSVAEPPPAVVEEAAEEESSLAEPDPVAVNESAEAERVAVKEPARVGPQAAISKLRGIATDDLSLIQMVERVAAALHERQQTGARTAPNRREEALAEALKALTVLSGGRTAMVSAETGGLQDSALELRTALAKLQELRGAA